MRVLRAVLAAFFTVYVVAPAWAADSTILVPTGQQLDTEELTVGTEDVQRQRIQIAGNAAASIAAVLNSAPGSSEYGLIVRPIVSGTQTISGTVTANAGTGTFTVDGTGGTFPASQSGTWTVQPGNTANTTPWLVNGGYAQGTASTDTDQVMMAGCERRDTAAAPTGAADGDRMIPGCASNGSLQVSVTNGSTTVTDASTFAHEQAGVPIVNSATFVHNGSAYERAATNVGSASSSTIRVAVARDSEICNGEDTAQVAVAVSSSGNTQLVALTSGQTIYVCDVTLVADGTVAAQLIYGTGTACGTGETDMTGPMGFGDDGGMTHNYNGRLKTAEANALCIELSGAVAVNGVVTYRKAATF